MNFLDYFSTQSDTYAKCRLIYPTSLIDYIVQQTPNGRVAWNCATGNGQVATALAPHFTQVYATDASQAQISKATAAPNITYSVATAEQSGLASQSMELITVGQALYWFNYQEVQRVARPKALIAV